MSGKKDILYARFPDKINRSLNIIGTISKFFMRRTAFDAFLSCGRNIRNSVVPAIIENQDCCLPINELIRDREFAEHRTSEPMHPHDHLLRFFWLALRSFSGVGPQPQSVQDELPRRRYFNDMSQSHM